MKLQTLACAVALATGGLFFTHVVNEAIAAESNAAASTAIQPSQEQALVSRQLATLVDRQHYLNQRLDANTSNRILDFYIDSLDPEHTLFLASEVADYKKRFGASFGANLKAGNLSGPYEIHAQYRARLKQFYSFMLSELKKPQNLNQPNTYIETDREKAPFFKSEAEQRAHWNKMLVSQLINLTISKEEDQAKQKALKDNPELANGQDLTGPEDLTPVQTLTKRFSRQLERVSRLKSDDVLDKTLNAMMLTYDPHSNYFPPVDAMELNRQTTLQRGRGCAAK
jgi:carboxyl-terminal processing protease